MVSVQNSKKRIKSRSNLFVWGFILTVMAAIAVAGMEQGPIGDSANEGIEFGAVVLSSAEDVSIGGMVQSFTFDKEKVKTIRDALRVLSALYKKNISPSPNVDGLLGITRLYDVTFDEAMDAVLGPNFKYEEASNLIKVYTKDEYKKLKDDPDRMIHRVFTLYYITAAEAEKLIKPVLSTPQGVVQASSAAEEGISIGKEGVSGSKGGGNNMAWHDTIVVYDYPENIAKAEEVIAKLDVKPKQVLIEATILSATLTEGMELGIDLNFLAGVSLTGADATPDLISEGVAPSRGAIATTPIGQIGAGVATGTPIETAGFAHVGGSGLRIGVTMGDFTALITALESVTDITVLANPKILALNKQAGTVFIGQELGYRDRTTIDA
ncbi:MAG TPA: hypothetical protein HPP66_08590, partial [Planctomycetes bacterium]|nr:hypothetical protein [Planctomycetota bacterium]